MQTLVYSLSYCQQVLVEVRTVVLALWILKL
jgi:hypothetical protein